MPYVSVCRQMPIGLLAPGLPGGELGSKERDLSADKIPVETISVAELFEELRDTEIIEL